MQPGNDLDRRGWLKTHLKRALHLSYHVNNEEKTFDKMKTTPIMTGES